MPAVILQIADAVVVALGAATLSQTFTAERSYVPVRELEEMGGTLFVTVVPTGLTAQLLNRQGQHLFDYVIDIGIQKRIGTGTMTEAEIRAACDPLMLFAEEVAELLGGKTLPIGSGKAVAIGVANQPIFVPAMLDEMKVFTSVVTLTFRLGR